MDRDRWVEILRCPICRKTGEAQLSAVDADWLITRVESKSIIDIATGQKPDRDPTPEEQGKDLAAVAMGKKGGAARAGRLTDARRKEIAEKAAASRWKKK
jgi:hypothetical protein